MLLNNAREKGAKVIEEVTVEDLIWEHTPPSGPLPGEVHTAPQPSGADSGRVVGVHARTRSGHSREFRAPITLDCTGKQAFTAVRNRWRRKDPFLNKVAVWTYYVGSKRESGIDEGQTTVAMIPEKGWFWHIPLHANRVSVGVVAEGKYLTREGVKDPRAIFEREINENLWIKDHLAPGCPEGDYWITSEYSFHSEYCGCEGLLLVGDAFAFLDPVFSSGLLLALKSGVMAGDAVHEALVKRDFAPDQFANYASALRHGIENMRKLVYAFYNPDFSFKRVIDQYPDLAGEITDCLSGDVSKDFTGLWKAIEEFAELPESLPVGGPLSTQHRPQVAPARG